MAQVEGADGAAEIVVVGVKLFLKTGGVVDGFAVGVSGEQGSALAGVVQSYLE